MQKNNNGKYFRTTKNKDFQLYPSVYSSAFLNRRISPFRASLKKLNFDSSEALIELFHKETKREEDYKEFLRQKERRLKRTRVAKWDLKVARYAFIQIFANTHGWNRTWETSKYALARWKNVFNLSNKLAKNGSKRWLKGYYLKLKRKFNIQNFEIFKNYFKIFIPDVRRFSRKEYRVKLFNLDPARKYFYLKKRRILSKSAQRKIKSKKLKKLYKTLFKKLSQKVKKKSGKKKFSLLNKNVLKKKKKIKIKIKRNLSSNKKKKTPSEIRKDLVLKMISRIKTPLKETKFKKLKLKKIKMFKHFFIFFRQQQWLAALFSIFNKNGKKKRSINYYLNIIIFLKKKYKKSSTFFVPLYFNQIMLRVLPPFGYKTVIKKRKRYRYPYIASSDSSIQRFRQNKALSIIWIKKAIFHSDRTELTVFLKLFSVLHLTRFNKSIACRFRDKYITIICIRKTYKQLNWAGRWI